MSGHYILEGDTVRAVDTQEWLEWMESDRDFSKRRVAQTFLNGVEVSTVFLTLDHNFYGGAPILFETLVFGGELDGEMERYSSKQEALIGHDEMVTRVQARLDNVY